MFEFRWTASRHVGAASENVAKMPQKISFMQVVREAHSDRAVFEVTAFWAPYDPLYCEMGTPLVNTDL